MKHAENGPNVKLIVLLSVCFVFLSLPAAAREKPILLDATFDNVTFGKQVAFLKDKTKTRTMDDILHPDSQWQLSDQSSIGLGFIDAAYWFRFTVNNVLAQPQLFYFELTYPHLDYLEVYIPQPTGGFEKIEAGDHYPFNKRQVWDKDFVFRISQPPGPATYYVRVDTTSSLNFEPVLRSQAAYLEKLNRVYPAFWLYYGALLIMIIYNLVLFFLVRDRTFFFLALFIFSFLLLEFALNGFAFQYLWPDTTWWANNCLPMLMCLTAGLFVLFVRQFANTAVLFAGQLPDKLEKYGAIAPNFIWAICSLSGNYALSIRVATGLLGITVVVFLVSVLLRGQSTRPLMIIGISCSVMGIGLLLFILKTVGVLPSNFITNWSVQIGSALFVGLLSLGLADKLTVLKNNLVTINANTSLVLQSISQDATDDAKSIKVCREDEVGEILNTRFQQFMSHFKDLVDAVKRNADLLNSAVGGLFDLSGRMTDQTGRMSNKADAVASASEEMNARMLSISATMEQAAQNVNLIASSAEEMTATVHEITGNTEAARRTTAEAVSQSNNVTKRVDELGYAAEKIGSVTEAIARISKKTNLLALNATIEAARAGMAGRGFAVVAGEIKALAGRTAEATQQISQQIEANREITAEAIREIRQIAGIISRVDEIVVTIASSIEEQSASAHEVAGNVSQISQGVEETNQSVAQCSEATGTVARDVWALSGASQQMNDNSSQIKKSAAELSQMAEYLNNLMTRFRL